MKPKALTVTALKNLKPRDERYEVSDLSCPGLYAVVFPSGKISFVSRLRFRGPTRKLTLGPWIGADADRAEPSDNPHLDTPLSLAAARELNVKARRQAKAGVDPCKAKRDARAKELAAESDTLAAVAQEYLRREGPKLRTLEQQRRPDLELICKSALGRQPIDGIKRGQYTRVLDHIADHNGPVRADRCLSALRTLLNWHASRSDFVSPLVRGMRKTSIKDRARSRILSLDELRALWITAERDPGPFGAYLRFMLLTATRRGEAAGLRRSELSDNATVWIIPGSRYKNGLDTLIPLSDAAQAIIAAQPQRGDFVFSVNGKRALGDFDGRKKEFDQLCGVSGYTLHDLRRTARTLLSRAGVAADIAERCLGHAMAGIRGTYDRHDYEAEKRDAFEALAALIERTVRPPANVVESLSDAKAARRQ